MKFLDDIKGTISKKGLFAELYGISKNHESGSYIMHQFQIDHQVADYIKNLFLKTINETILSDDFAVKDVSQIDTGERGMYLCETKQDGYNPFNFVWADKPDRFNDQLEIEGYIVKIGISTSCLYIYQNLFSMGKVKGEKKLVLLREDLDGFQYIQKSGIVYVLENRIDCIFTKETIGVNNIALMQSKFGFTEYITNQSTLVLDVIKTMSILPNISYFESWITKDFKNAKKLLKAKNSDVLKIEKTDLLSRVKGIEAYTKLVNKDEFVIDSLSKVILFVKMLNDSILFSLLTKNEYEANSKTKVEEPSS